MGVEPTPGPCKNKDLGQSIDEKAGKSKVFAAKSKRITSDLASIVAVWPELPEHIKAAIKALVQTHNSEGE